MEGYIPPLERRRPTVFAALWLVLLSVAGLWIASAAVGALAPGGASMFLSDFIYYGPFVLLPIALYCARRGGLSDALRLNPLPLFPALLVMMLAVMSVYAASAVNSVWALALNALGLPEPAAGVDVRTPRALMLAVVHTAAVPAVCEELLCRGVALSAFEDRGTARAIWISAALFALMHLSLFGLPAYLLVGAVSGFIVFAVDSLYAGMLYHTVYNAAILVVLHRIDARATADAAALAEAPAAALMASLAFDLVLVGLSLAMLLNALNLRRRALGIVAAPRARVPLSGREKALAAALLAALAASMVAMQAMTGV